MLITCSLIHTFIRLFSSIFLPTYPPQNFSTVLHRSYDRSYQKIGGRPCAPVASSTKALHTSSTIQALTFPLTNLRKTIDPRYSPAIRAKRNAHKTFRKMTLSIFWCFNTKKHGRMLNEQIHGDTLQITKTTSRPQRIHN